MLQTSRPIAWATGWPKAQVGRDLENYLVQLNALSPHAAIGDEMYCRTPALEVYPKILIFKLSNWYICVMRFWL
jgi:hypothetical protein